MAGFLFQVSAIIVTNVFERHFPSGQIPQSRPAWTCVPKKTVMNKKPVRHEYTWIDEFSVGAKQLSNLLNRLLAKGNVRQLVILRPDGRVLFKISLTTGVAIAGVFTILAPVLTALGSMAALLAEIRVRVVYIGPPRRD